MSDSKDVKLNIPRLVDFGKEKRDKLLDLLTRLHRECGEVFKHIQLPTKDRLKVVVAYITPGSNLVIWGPPATGKTTLNEAFCALLFGAKVGKVSCNELSRPDDIIWDTRVGLRKVNEVLQEYESVVGLREPFQCSVVHLEEGNRLSPVVYQALIPILSGKAFTEQGQRFDMTHIIMFVFDGNPYAGPFSDRAFLSRIDFGMEMNELEVRAQYDLLHAKLTGNFQKLPAQAFNEEDMALIHEAIAAIEIPRKREVDLQLISNVLTRCVKGNLGRMTDEYRRDKVLMKCGECPCSGSCFIQHIEFPIGHRAAEAIQKACKAFAFLRGGTEVEWEDMKQAFVLVMGHRPVLNMKALGEFENSFAFVEHVASKLDDIMEQHWNPLKKEYGAVKKLKASGKLAEAGGKYTKVKDRCTNAVGLWWWGLAFETIEKGAAAEGATQLTKLKGMRDGSIAWVKKDLDDLNAWSWIPKDVFDEIQRIKKEMEIVLKGGKSLPSQDWAKQFLAPLVKKDNARFGSIAPPNMTGSVQLDNGGVMDVQVSSNGKNVDVNWSIEDSGMFQFFKELLAY